MYICTVVTKSHLAYARTLAISLREASPYAQLYVLLADRVDGYFLPTAEPFHLICLHELGHPELIGRMAFYYTAFEFCNALRPFLHEFMWNHTQAAQWIYLDSDIHVTGDLSCIDRAAGGASVLLNPHNTRPVTNEFFFKTELPQLRAGVFNGGFVGLSRSEPAQAFIKWFRDRMVRYCLADAPGLFVDQIWLNHVPNFFRGVGTFTHPGANLAHWNLFERALRRDAAGNYLADDQPLLFVHFSGWDINNPDDVSMHSPGYRTADLPQLVHWRTLAARYKAALLANGLTQSMRWPYAFSTGPDGQLLSLEHRRLYYKQVWTRGAAPAVPLRIK